jgi:hypothetical protein
MVDYYKIVQRSVAALNPDTEASRQALYERARASLAKHLCLKNPPVPNDNIRAELSALEEAIKEVESEAWSKRYEIKEKREATESDNARAAPKRSAVFRFAPSAMLLAASVAYFMLWMRFTDSGSFTASAVLLLVFALPAAFVLLFVLYPILSPLLWLLRWLNKKLLQRLVGGEIIANVAGATLLSAALCAICASQAPSLFSWWAAGWCWIGCAFLVTLDPAIVGGLRSLLRRVQRSKPTTAKSRETTGNEQLSPAANNPDAQKPLTPEEAPKNAAA